jgi:hypothetical protein
MSKPKFNCELKPLSDTNVDVVFVTNEEGKRVCIIHPESGEICFRFVGLVSDVSQLQFYTHEEIKEILFLAKKIRDEYKKFGTFVKNLSL